SPAGRRSLVAGLVRGLGSIQSGIALGAWRSRRGPGFWRLHLGDHLPKGRLVHRQIRGAIPGGAIGHAVLDMGSRRQHLLHTGIAFGDRYGNPPWLMREGRYQLPVDLFTMALELLAQAGSEAAADQLFLRVLPVSRIVLENVEGLHVK